MTVESNPLVVINTAYGHFFVELFQTEAPITVDNFLAYVDSDFYAGTIFHRVVDDFVIQGGGILSNLQPLATNPPIVLESDNGLSNQRGTLAMARTPAADSATSQFFVNMVNNSFLDYQSAASPGYAVFGQVTDGMDVVDAISNAHTFSVTVGSATTYDDLPFPLLIEILSAERYDPAATQTPTTYVADLNAYGVAQANFAGQRADYGVRLNMDGTLSVTQLDGSHAAATLNAERLNFGDSGLAFDIDGAAGETARMINAAFGYSYLTPNLNWIGLDLFDQGLGMEAVAQLALDCDLWQEVAGSSDNAAFVSTVYANAVGSAPDAYTADYFQSILDNGEMTQAQMLVMAAESDANSLFIDMVGLASAGLEYWPPAA